MMRDCLTTLNRMFSDEFGSLAPVRRVLEALSDLVLGVCVGRWRCGLVAIMSLMSVRITRNRAARF